MRVAACSRKVDLLRWTPPSPVCPLTAEDVPDGDNCGERMSRVESKSDSDAPGSVTGVDDRGVSMSPRSQPLGISDPLLLKE